MLAIVFGIQGTGKSSVIKLMMDSFPEGTWTRLQWGDAAYELCLKNGIIRVGDYTELSKVDVISEDEKRGLAIVTDGRDEMIYVRDQQDLPIARDEIRNLGLKTQEKLQKQVSDYYKDLINADSRQNYVIDTHAALKTTQGYLPGMTEDFLKSTKPDIFIVVEANAGEIMVRRLLDTKRKREHDKSVWEVQTNLDTTRYFASFFANYVHSPLMIIENKEKRAEEAAAEMAQVLGKFLK